MIVWRVVGVRFCVGLGRRVGCMRCVNRWVRGWAGDVATRRGWWVWWAGVIREVVGGQVPGVSTKQGASWGRRCRVRGRLEISKVRLNVHRRGTRLNVGL